MNISLYDLENFKFKLFLVPLGMSSSHINAQLRKVWSLRIFESYESTPIINMLLLVARKGIRHVYGAHIHTKGSKALDW